MKRCIPLLLIMALICTYIPVTASAAFFDENENLNVSLFDVFYNSGYSYIYYDGTNSLYLGSDSLGHEIRSSMNDVYSFSDEYISVDGDLKNYTFTSGWIIERGSLPYITRRASKGGPLVCRTVVSCYDVNKSFLGYVFSDMPIPTIEDIYVTSSTVYGLQLPLATSFVQVRSAVGYMIQRASNFTTDTPLTGYAEMIAPYHTFSSFYSMKTPLGTYYSSEYPQDESEIQSYWIDSSFDGDTIYTEDDTFNLMLLAYGYNVNLTAEFKTYNEDGDLLDTTSGSFIQDSANNYQYIELRKWVYGYRTIVCNVYYESSLIDSFSCIAMPASYDGSGSSGSSGDNSLVLEKIEFLDTELQEVQEGIYGVSNQVNELSEQIDSVGDKIDESNSFLSDIVDGITSLPERIMDGIKGLFVPDAEAMAEQQKKWEQLLADRFGLVYESIALIDDIAEKFTSQDAQGQIEFPSVSVPLGDITWEFGGWMVDVVPDGFEILIEALKKIIDILCTVAFVNAMKNRFDRVLEARG